MVTSEKVFPYALSEEVTPVLLLYMYIRFEIVSPHIYKKPGLYTHPFFHLHFSLISFFLPLTRRELRANHQPLSKENFR